MPSKPVVLTGGDLTIDQIWQVTNNGVLVRVDAKCKIKVDKSRKFVEKIGESVLTYGVNTGFGPMAQYVLSKKQINQLQYNLIRSHATGMGEYLTRQQCMSVMLVRLNTLLKGRSGVRWSLIKQIELYINSGIVPAVPRYGSVGASGDLVQLAHVALALIGEGKVYYKGRVKKTSSVLKRLKIKPSNLVSKEGLALINGTAAMSGIGSLVLYEARKIIDLAIVAGAYTYELMAGFDDPISSEIQALRPHKGQIFVAKKMRNALSTSKLLQHRLDLAKKIDVGKHDVRKIDHKVQDVYSIRCLPQIYGPIWEVIQNAKRVIEVEINSVTDNPITNGKADTLLHGGNFHGDYVSFEMDKVKIGLSRIAMTVERHVNIFLNPNVRDHLPPFLNLRKPGFDIALQGLQFVATSTTAEIQTLCFPNYVHSITTNADNQDIVSMGTNSSLLSYQVIEAIKQIIGVGLITLAQATDVMGVNEEISKSSDKLYKKVRAVFPVWYKDKDFTSNLEAFRKNFNTLIY
ncbi:MAG: HAL/PAL/TAL family ammonia-lyase [Patescibacteria group bacterium]